MMDRARLGMRQRSGRGPPAPRARARSTRRPPRLPSSRASPSSSERRRGPAPAGTEPHRPREEHADAARAEREPEIARRAGPPPTDRREHHRRWRTSRTRPARRRRNGRTSRSCRRRHEREEPAPRARATAAVRADLRHPRTRKQVHDARSSPATNSAVIGGTARAAHPSRSQWAATAAARCATRRVVHHLEQVRRRARDRGRADASAG